MKLFHPALAALTLVAVAGCASSGTEISQDQLSTLQKGKTTYAEVIAKFGAPNGSTMTSEGLQIITYARTETKVKAATFIPIVGAFAGGATGHVAIVTLTFDKAGVLESFTSTSSNSDVNNGLGS